MNSSYSEIYPPMAHGVGHVFDGGPSPVSRHRNQPVPRGFKPVLNHGQNGLLGFVKKMIPVGDNLIRGPRNPRFFGILRRWWRLWPWRCSRRPFAGRGEDPHSPRRESPRCSGCKLLCSRQLPAGAPRRSPPGPYTSPERPRSGGWTSKPRTLRPGPCRGERPQWAFQSTSWPSWRPGWP